MLERWSRGVLEVSEYSITPTLHHSNPSLPCQRGINRAAVEAADDFAVNDGDGDKRFVHLRQFVPHLRIPNVTLGKRNTLL